MQPFIHVPNAIEVLCPEISDNVYPKITCIYDKEIFSCDPLPAQFRVFTSIIKELYNCPQVRKNMDLFHFIQTLIWEIQKPININILHSKTVQTSFAQNYDSIIMSPVIPKVSQTTINQILHLLMLTYDLENYQLVHIHCIHKFDLPAVNDYGHVIF